MGCEAESWSPEVYTFYGDAQTVVSKMNGINMNLPTRRLYFFTLETDKGAELMLFEGVEKAEKQKSYESGEDDPPYTKVNVGSWQGPKLGSLGTELQQAMIENRGVACMGEQSQYLIAKEHPLKDLGKIPVPVSARAAFGHAIKRHSDEFIRVTAYLMC